MTYILFSFFFCSIYLPTYLIWKCVQQDSESHFSKAKKDCLRSLQFSSVTQSCPTFCDPMDCNTPGLPVHHQLPELTQTHVHQVGDAIQPSHPYPLLLLPAIFPNIRVFSNESVFGIKWPKYWSFSFIISPSNELGLIFIYFISHSHLFQQQNGVFLSLVVFQWFIQFTNQRLKKRFLE